MTGLEDPERCQTLGYTDSGGPLVCRLTGRWYHLGAVSWGEFCSEASITPGVYSSTVSMRDWVIQTLDTHLSVMERLEQMLRKDINLQDKEAST